MARNDGYLSAKESRRISKENKAITSKLEKKRTRRNVPESEYLTEMKNPANAVQFSIRQIFPEAVGQASLKTGRLSETDRRCRSRGSAFS